MQYAVNLALKATGISKEMTANDVAKSFSTAGDILDVTAMVVDSIAVWVVAAVTVRVTPIATLGSGPAGPIEAYLAGELVATPLLLVGNILATEATACTMISESITGDLGANITVQSAQNGFSVIGNLSIGSGSAVGLATTLGGWVPIVPSWGFLALQTLTVANDFGLLGVTKKEIPIRFSTFVSE